MGVTQRPIILIQPRTGDWDNLGSRIPESLLNTVSFAVKEGYNIQIIDQRVEPEWKERLGKLLQQKPLLVGTTAMTGPQIKFAVEISEIIRKFDPKIPIMWGGLHPTMQPLQTLSNPAIDILIIGEGEKTLL